jgi:hypothetical protein
VAIAMTAALVGTDAAANAQSGGPQEGIKVIGEWTILVRDVDGNVVQRSDFRNALIAGQGSGSLATVLSRQRPIGEWVILLSNSGAGTQPCGTAAAGKSCGMVEQLSSQLQFQGGVDYVPGLTVGLDPANGTRVRLQGSMKATGSGTITTVSTMLGRCPVGPPTAAGCTSTQDFFYFSGTQNFANPPTVVQGQTIDVTVTFSFQ